MGLPEHDANSSYFGRTFGGRIQLRRVRLNSGGYTSRGQYFGNSTPLYNYYNVDPVPAADLPYTGRDEFFDGYIRAADRAAAIAKLRKLFPLARFPGDKAVRPRKANGRPAAPMSALRSVWTTSDRSAVGHWASLQSGYFEFDVRLGDRGRWSAEVTRAKPRLRLRSDGHASQDDARLWCEQTAWAAHGDEMAAPKKNGGRSAPQARKKRLGAAAYYVRAVSGGFARYDATGEYLGTSGDTKGAKDLRSAFAALRSRIRGDASRRGILR